MVVPYRRWPAAALLFHDMLRTAQELTVEDAHRLGIIDDLAPDIESLHAGAAALVRDLAGTIHPPPGGPVEVPAFTSLDPSVFHERGVSSEVTGIIEAAVLAAAAAPCLDDALEIGYAAFAASACTDAAREKVTAFVSRRKG
jgi:enoyl-CoA hydratase/3-hydroxyacyl-CoA dehydrogenase